jgi:hypothetical protein
MSSRRLSFANAVQLLDGTESSTARLVGKALGAGTNISVFGLADFLDLKDSVVTWGKHLTAGLQDRLLGLRRFDRTERLEAAHAVIVITSLFEALDDHLRTDMIAAQIRRTEQVSLAVGDWPGRTYQSLVTTLLDSQLPIPTPFVPFEQVLTSLTAHYTRAVDQTIKFIHELHGSRPLPTATNVVSSALRRYTEAYRQLATQVPEFGIWSSMNDLQATRNMVREYGTGLRGISQLLDRVSSAYNLDETRAGLVSRYRSDVERPLLDAADLPSKPRSTDLILQVAFCEFEILLVILVVAGVVGSPTAVSACSGGFAGFQGCGRRRPSVTV